MLMSKKVERTVGLVFVAAALTLGGFAYRAGRQFDALERSARAAETSHETLRTLDAFYSALLDAETGQRGYLLTRQDDYLDPYRLGIATTWIHFNKLARQIEQTPAQAERIAMLSKLTAAKLAELGRTIALREAGRGDKAMEIVMRNEGKALMEEIREVTTRIMVHEQALADAQSEKAHHARIATERMFIVVQLCLGMAFLGAFLLIRRGMGALRGSKQALARSERRLRDVTDNLPVLISYIDTAHRLQFCNGTYKSWLQVDPGEAVGRHVSEVVGEQLYAERAAQIDKALGGQVTKFEIRSVALDGRERCLQTTYLPDRREDGSVAGIYALSADITDLKRVEQQLTRMARFDALTGLANRHQFDDRLREAMARCERSGRPMALLFLDVDRFKTINDTLGHAAGDQVLKEFALRLTRCVRKTDMVARLAGDEFVIVLEGLHGAGEPELVARKILAAMRPEFELDGGQVRRVSTSIGVAVYRGGRGSAANLMSEADQALYQAKGDGRNTFRMALLQAA